LNIPEQKAAQMFGEELASSIVKPNDFEVLAPACGKVIEQRGLSGSCKAYFVERLFQVFKGCGL